MTTTEHTTASDKTAASSATPSTRSERHSFGYALHTGEKSFNIVGRARVWLLISLALIALSIAGPFLRGLNLGIEFTGGNEFTISQPATQDEMKAVEAAKHYSETPAKVSRLGDGGVRVQTDSMDGQHTNQLRDELAREYGVDGSHVAVSSIGPSWGADITRQMLIGLGIFIALAALLMALYFKTWKMSLAAIAALAHDLIVTMGVYALTGFEITPATIIGFLTILGYSLYDTVVVFDRIREVTRAQRTTSTRTFAESVNFAVNQTLVRSINTSIVALLPVAAILFIGAWIMGAGTLRDISLALFIGIIVGALSTIFLAAPLYAILRTGERGVRRLDRAIRLGRGESEAEAIARTGGSRVVFTDEELARDDHEEETVAAAEKPARPALAPSAPDAEDPWELRGTEPANGELRTGGVDDDGLAPVDAPVEGEIAPRTGSHSADNAGHTADELDEIALEEGRDADGDAVAPSTVVR